MGCLGAGRAEAVGGCPSELGTLPMFCPGKERQGTETQPHPQKVRAPHKTRVGDDHLESVCQDKTVSS